jgi:hypothetical protein
MYQDRHHKLYKSLESMQGATFPELTLKTVIRRGGEPKHSFALPLALGPAAKC